MEEKRRGYNEKAGRPFITVTDLYITFSTLAVRLLEYTPYVHLYLDRSNKQIAFVACKKDRMAIPFYKESGEGKQVLVRLNSKERVATILDIIGLKDCGQKALKFYGEYLGPDDKAIVFDLKNHP